MSAASNLTTLVKDRNSKGKGARMTNIQNLNSVVLAWHGVDGDTRIFRAEMTTFGGPAPAGWSGVRRELRRALAGQPGHCCRHGAGVTVGCPARTTRSHGPRLWTTAAVVVPDDDTAGRDDKRLRTDRVGVAQA